MVAAHLVQLVSRVLFQNPTRASDPRRSGVQFGAASTRARRKGGELNPLSARVHFEKEHFSKLTLTGPPEGCVGCLMAVQKY